MGAVAVRWLVPALALALTGCGSSDRFDLRTPPPAHVPVVRPDGRVTAGGAARATPPATTTTAKVKPVTSGEAHVIRRWASELRHGHVAQAARAFALPVVVANGGVAVELRTRAQTEAFNRSLPCGAVVVRLDRAIHHLVITTFRLVERPGPGSCGSGVGQLARTAFLIRHGRITRWLRVADPPAAGGNAS
jgi:hypothetical protein